MRGSRTQPGSARFTREHDRTDDSRGSRGRPPGQTPPPGGDGRGPAHFFDFACILWHLDLLCPWVYLLWP